MDEIEVVIGLEVHVQLLTQSKVFCGCPNRFNPDEPNTQVCPVCLGLPGSLPVLNAEALDLSIRAGLGLGCEIAEVTKWDRKQYFYPDLPKGYQISQYDQPVCGRGEVTIATEGRQFTVGITRAHLEEDAGKTVHGGGVSRVDLNRAGTPLLEIVTEPDLRSATDARAFLSELRLLMRYLEVSDCNMQEGSLRCDANVNLRIPESVHGRGGGEAITPICEVKNLNSFRAVEQAIEHETLRQQKAFAADGLRIDSPGALKTTRGFDADRGVTTPQREKEGEADYRYFPDPDLLPIPISPQHRTRIEATVCERPADRRRRYVTDLGLGEYDAGVLIDAGRPTADYFEAAASAGGDAKAAANWVTQDIAREVNDRGVAIGDLPVGPAVLGELLRRVSAGELANKGAREVFAALLRREATEPSDVAVVIEELGLTPGDDAELEGTARELVAGNAKVVDAVRSGKDAAVGPLVGQMMKRHKGANPGAVRELLLNVIRG